MPVSMHSHSGEFCGHATNTLLEVVERAKSLGIGVFALTEHMPRDADEDLYPEEIALGTTPHSLAATFAAYHAAARHLQRTHSTPSFRLLVGMEIDWIRPASAQLVARLVARYEPDVVVGSVHHVHAVPIDYDRPLYEKARARSGGTTDERLFEDYYDAQLAMLQALEPPVVGHFDLIRLKSDDPDTTARQWPGVWSRVLRNLDVVAAYGGVLEINSAALRKGMREPYPCGRICQAFVERGGLFTLSDDSHGVEQVGFGLGRAIAFAREMGVEAVTTFEVKLEPGDDARDREGLASEPRRTIVKKTVPWSELAGLRHFGSADGTA